MDLLSDTLTKSNSDSQLSLRHKSQILNDCMRAYKDFGSIVALALTAEKQARDLIGKEAESDTQMIRVPASLMEFIPKVSPAYQAPNHLRRFVDVLEGALNQEKRIVVSCPPQFGKTDTTIHDIVWFLCNKPHLRNAYVSYAAERAEQMSLRMQWIADEIGLKYEGTRRNWRTPQGGGVICTGIGGPLTGFGFDGLVIVDDPFKGMADANSPVLRSKVREWFQSVLMTRVHKGASVIVISTRWHPEDLSGELIAEGWDYINLPALTDDGKSLWPEKWPTDLLTRRRVEVGEYVWSALYMGEPRPKGGQIFGQPTFYSFLPEGDRRTWIGIDFAYTGKSSADYSVAVVMIEIDGKFYVADLIRVQEEPPKFRDRVHQLKKLYPNAILAVGVANTEVGSAHFMSEQGLDLNIQKATADKFLRAQPVAAAWNAGNVLLPEYAEWLQDMRHEVQNFTGLGDNHDDIVDALSAAFNAAKYGNVNWNEIERAQREAPKALDWMT